MYLVTPRCLVRNLSSEDAAQLYEILSDSDVMAFIEVPFSLEDTKEFIEQAGMCSPPLVYALVWRENGQVIGHVIFHPYRDAKYEIGWIIHKEYWFKGVATEVTLSLIEYAIALGTKEFIIECDPKQAASKHIAMKCGFSYIGEEDGCSVYHLKLE